MQKAIERYPKNNNFVIQYGTSGFRSKADELEHVVFRMGLLAALRSRARNSSAIGLMITASHNPEQDNGVKLIDPHGEMLEQSWEPLATTIANADDNILQEELTHLVLFFGIDVSKPSLVFIGRDTRPSSPLLAAAANAGVEAYNGRTIDQGVVSTPVLHYLVHSYNTSTNPELPLTESYYIRLSSAFKALKAHEGAYLSYTPEVDFDGANGVGGLVMQQLLPLLGKTIKIRIYNCDTNTKGKLNHLCGADFVKTQQKPPEGFKIESNRRIASVDGDADRVVYSYLDSNRKFHLLDGDRIATLVAGYLVELVQESGLKLGFGLVQTAYANGNSTKYISQILKVPVACVSTGVKHLHHKALEYDIGIYFEANGHGTVVFSNNARNLITQAMNDDKLDSTKRNSVMRLKQLSELINSTVGDAISDMLLVETILEAKGWSIQEWESAYTDLPSRLVKVSVKDRYIIETTDAARKCTKPEGLQAKINGILNNYKNGRSFVRPSGTEDVVRVYAEAETQVEADNLANEVARAVYDLAGGIGEIPLSSHL